MIPGVVVRLADGNDYVLPPLAFASMELFESDVGQKISDPKIAYRVIQHAISRNYPHITRDMLKGKMVENDDGTITWQIKPLIDNSCLFEVMEAVMDLSGIKRRSQEEAKKAAAVNP